MQNQKNRITSGKNYCIIENTTLNCILKSFLMGIKKYRKNLLALLSMLFLLPVVLLVGCEKRRPKFTQLTGDNYYAIPVKSIDLEGEYRIFIFMSPECPLSENYTKTLLSLSRNYIDQKVRFYLVFPGKFYPKGEIEVFLKRYRIPHEMVIYDPEYRFRDYFEATITPESFLTDIGGRILYRGGIDNWAITLGKQRQVITAHYLSDAIDSAIKNEKIKNPKTRAVGCIIE